MWRFVCLALLLAPAVIAAQDSNGWAKLGAVLGGGIDREGVYMQEQVERAEREALFYEVEAQRHDLETRRRNERTRSQLAELWQAAGFAPSDAKALAAAYEPDASEVAVIAGVRRKGVASTVPDINDALDSHSYLLANQLLIALVVVSGNEPPTTEPE